jgi:hypothetical protein
MTSCSEKYNFVNLFDISLCLILTRIKNIKTKDLMLEMIMVSSL